MVTPGPTHVCLAVTLARLGAELLAGALVTHALVHGAVSLAVTQRADVRVSDLTLRILRIMQKDVIFAQSFSFYVT